MAEPGVAERAIRQARKRGATRLAIKALLEAGITESGLQHAKYSRVGTGDRDSVGFLQQRPSQGWGPAGESVEKDTNDFLDRALPLIQGGFRGSAGQLAQAVQRSAYPGRYDTHAGEAESLMRSRGVDSSGQRIPGGRGGGSSGSGGGGGGSILDVTSRRIPGRTTALAGRTFETTVPTLDTEGYERARKLSVVGQMIARRNPQSILLRSGLLSTSEPSISDFMGQRTTANTVPGVTVRTPGMTALSAREINLPGGGGGSGDGGRGSARAAGARGSYKITGPNPNRIQPKVRGFLGELSAVAGETIVGSDGTGHSKFTVNGNVSEHFTGSATDIPAKGGHLTRLGQAALIAAGMPPSKARKVKGGLFNVNRGGHRYQIIFNTMEGGNHYDHLHVGVH